MQQGILLTVVHYRVWNVVLNLLIALQRLLTTISVIILNYSTTKYLHKFNKINVKIFQHSLNLFFQNYSNMARFFA